MKVSTGLMGSELHLSRPEGLRLPSGDLPPRPSARPPLSARPFATLRRRRCGHALALKKV
eukprot:199972-Prorocentrum_minimum.AAC.1